MFKTLLITAALIVSATTASLAAPAWTTGSVHFRDGPGTYYAKLGTVSRCVRVETDRSESGWYRINWNGRWGWVSARYLTWDGGYCTSTYRPPSKSYNKPASGGY